MQPKKLGDFFRLTFPFDLPNWQTLRYVTWVWYNILKKLFGHKEGKGLIYQSGKVWLTLKI